MEKLDHSEYLVKMYKYQQAITTAANARDWISATELTCEFVCNLSEMVKCFVAKLEEEHDQQPR